MEQPRRAPGPGNVPEPPGADTTAAGAFAPPPASGRTVLGFVAGLVLLVCGVAGVLLLFTDVAVGYALLCLAVAALAAVALGVGWRRGR